MGDDATELAAAKQAVKDGEAGLEERWLLLRHFAGTQRWELAAPHLDRHRVARGRASLAWCRCAPPTCSRVGATRSCASS